MEGDSGDARVIAVTGASAGIGRAISEHLGGLGWTVALGARRMHRLMETRAAVERAGGKGFASYLDVGDAESVDEFFRSAEAQVGPISGVVNNAAVARYGPLHDFTPEEIAREIQTKLIGSLYMSRRAIIGMREHDIAGDILFITSVAASQPWPYHLPYASAGAGLEHAARTLKLELEGGKIRVHTFRCDATMGTEFADREREAGRLVPAMRMWYRLGLQRHFGYLTADQVADAVLGALTLPPGLQYDLFTLSPMAPEGPLPETWEMFAAPFQ
jgi:NAD(P)-dependent dehydrogenase (short-subunit alcohol dehydrogenase family)